MSHSASWSDVVKKSATTRAEPESDQDHQPGHATAQSRDPPPNTSYADLTTPSAASASFSTSARKFAQGHGDPVSKVLDRVSSSTVHSGTGEPTSDSPSAFPSLQAANPHTPHDVDPVLAPLVDDSIAQGATRDVPVEITKAAGSADVKQGATAANTLAAAAESSSSATNLPQAGAAVKDSDLGRALDKIEPRDKEPNVTIEPPAPVVPLTETPRGGKAVQLGVIEATQQNIPIRTSAAPHDKSVIDSATGGFVPGTQEKIEPKAYATTADQPEFVDTPAEPDAGTTRTGPSEIEKGTGGFVPGTKERILHASGTSAPPSTPISPPDASPTSSESEQVAEAQVPMLPETLAKPSSTGAGKHADREPEWVPISTEPQHAKHAAGHAVHKAKQAVPTSVHEVKESAAQAVDKVKDAMPSGESVAGAVSGASSTMAAGASKVAQSTKSAADQASTSIADTAAQAKATFGSAYDSATSTASSAVDSLKPTLLPSTTTESSDAKPLSHAERADALLDQIQDVAAIGPDAVRATLAAGSSSSVESGSVGGSTGPTPAKEHAMVAASHGHKMTPEEAAEARVSNLFSKFGGGAAAHKQASDPHPAATAVSGGGNTATSRAQLVESTPTSANRADQILANYESAASIGPDAVRAALAAGTTHYPHHKEQQDKPKDVPPAVAQRILEQARASIDQLTASGHSEVDLVATESSPSASSSIDTTLGEGLDYAASFARGVRAGMTEAARDVEREVTETIRKSEGELAIPMTPTAEQARAETTNEAVHHRADQAKEALAPVVVEGTVETMVHAASDVVTKVESGLLSIAESVGLYHGNEE